MIALEAPRSAQVFHDLVLNDRDKLLNPCLSCRSRSYTTRKSLQQSAEVRLSSARVYYWLYFQGSKLFFLAHSWHHPAASDPLSVDGAWKTKRCKRVDFGKNYSTLIGRRQRRASDPNHAEQICK